jgi:ABC-type amino acid transport substrate-binding protein
MANGCLRRIQVVLASCLFSILFAATATAEPYALLVGKNGYPPFVIVDTDDAGAVVYRGVVVDFLDAFDNQYPGYERQFVSLPRKRANAAMARGQKIDLMFQSPMFAEPAVRDHYQFTESLYRSKDVVVTRKGDALIYRSPEDLFGRKVSTISGYGYGIFDELFDNGKISDRRVNLHTQAIQLLDRKRVDAYLGNIHVSPYFIGKLGLDPSSFRFSENSLFEFDLAFMVNRKKGGLLDDLNTFVRDSRDNGLLKEIMEGYIRQRM